MIDTLHFRLRRAVLLGLLVLTSPGFLCGQEASLSGDWSQWRGPNRDGISLETNWRTDWSAESPPVVWKHNVGTGYSGVSIYDGRAYTMGRTSNQDVVCCLDAASGQSLWKYSYAIGKYCQRPAQDVGPASTPTISDGRVYALGLDGEFQCLDAQSGALLWDKHLMSEFGVTPPPYGFSTAPLMGTDEVFVDVGCTLAFNKTNGALLWKTTNYGSSYASPMPVVFDNQPSVMAFNATGLLVFAATNGAELFRQDWSVTGIDNVNSGTPIIRQDKVFVASTYESGWGLIELRTARKPAIVWRKQHEFHLFATPVLIGDSLYTFNASILQCLDFNTGDVAWSQKGFGSGTVMAAGGKLIVLSEKGELVIVDPSPAAYKEISRTQVLGGKCWTVPTLVNGKFYCRNSKGDLVCLNLVGQVTAVPDSSHTANP